jgi:hypothetical protein
LGRRVFHVPARSAVGHDGMEKESR